MNELWSKKYRSVFHVRRIMLNLLRATCAAKRPQPAMRHPFVLAGIAMLTGHILMPHPSFAGVNLTNSSPQASLVNCSRAPVTSTRQCHLDLNDRMKMDLGTWGTNSVHPHGPNYFCVEHQRQLEEARKRGC
jgi:hypothetical protein